MEQTKSDGFLLSLGRTLVFGASIVFAFGWLVDPESVGKARNLLADYVHLTPEVVSDRSASAMGSAILPAVVLEPLPFHLLATRVAVAESDGATSPSSSKPQYP